MTFLKGMDISDLAEIEKHGGVYFDRGIKKDAVKIFAEHGINLARIRIWNDPYDEKGNPYGGGTSDVKTFLSLAKRAKECGMGILADFHYSDFWADPGKQTMPKAWRSFPYEELKKALYEFTKETLEHCVKEKVIPEYVAVGNEVTNGLCWPIGKVPAFDRIAGLISAGIRAVRETVPSAKVMIHLDNGGNKKLYENWFREYFENGGEDFDAIGLSYYPLWHGSPEDLEENLCFLSGTYGKELIIAETSYPFTLADYAEYETYMSGKRKGMAIKPELLENCTEPFSPEGQCSFLGKLARIVVDNPCGKGIIWWGGALIPREGSSWGNDNAIEYAHEKGPGGNEWANQAVFDFDGNALPVLDRLGRIVDSCEKCDKVKI
ncbi:MAG: glycosyl hydrolase 53 family protein [Erysipelotrichales bacterium]|nr:glycosyl hydrolase 53 family protein [Erysipelotrichales bacterium]